MLITQYLKNKQKEALVKPELFLDLYLTYDFLSLLDNADSVMGNGKNLNNFIMFFTDDKRNICAWNSQN